jgi:hypothetical protein
LVNAVRLLNFATAKNLIVENTVLHIVTFINLPGHLMVERHNQIDHILINRRLHSSILDVRSFRAADCDTDYYPVVVKVRERLEVSKQTTHRAHMKRFNINKLNEVEGKCSIVFKSQIGSQLWKT